ncbi:hypothetical protein [Deinococcus cellulosilyticus]|uniref:Uncharacterized protein n=1 Tax=Deinococcus cellulosilyticus (strain DSM 18568 / NBRC 106333 / KACC 11606 / 5516J-15) TaxID=1223518 RepID=A0A511N9Z6_DEIC1|nr:hypothetical protein [Deinococcus cellulosilyticus]GEM49201.1 hypothetical protein DC3_48360 [Deinococcus cellulosilyticus NBRC 106333 = KACC 11606]
MKPVALIGPHQPELPEVLRRVFEESHLQLVPHTLPQTHPSSVLQSLSTLGYAGGLISDDFSESYFSYCARVGVEARRIGRIDTLSSLGGGFDATHTLEDSLFQWMENSGYRSAGAKVMVIGGNFKAKVALQLARLGFVSVMLAAQSMSVAEDLLKVVPVGIEKYPLVVGGYTFASFMEQQDLLIITEDVGKLRFQPYHQVMDLSDTYGQVIAQDGAHVWDNSQLEILRLSHQLKFLTGRGIAPSLIQWAWQAVREGA